MRFAMVILPALAAGVACGPPDAPGGGGPGTRKVLGSFTGTVDVGARAMTISRSGAGAGVLAARTIPEGSGEGTITVSNVTTPSQGGGCGGGALSFTGQVAIQSSSTGTVLQNVYAVIDTVSLTGVAACNGDLDPLGISPASGILWSYGSIAAGGSRSHAWTFSLPGATSFTFTGHVVADEVPSASCAPSCPGECGGDDACGGDCAVTCAPPNQCDADGSCACAPMCAGLPCWSPDGCGGTCDLGSGCACFPMCAGLPCGSPDGCGGSCDLASGCMCFPMCAGLPCGTPDGCGGSCDLASGCMCSPTCAGMPCGMPDGCGGICAPPFCL